MVEAQESVVRIGGDGRPEAIDDAAELMEIEEESERLEAAQEAQVAEANELLALIAPQQESIVVPVTIEVVEGVFRKFNVKRFSHTEVSKLDAKKYRRGPGGQLIKDIEQEETVGQAWLIHLGIVRNANEGKVDKATGQPLKAVWEPLFTVAQILGDGNRPGLMSNENPDSQDLISKLTREIWTVNPNTNPILAAAAAAQLGLPA